MLSSNTSAVSGDAVYVEDVFSTYLYTGNSSSQTINNGIDLAGKGGMVWVKARNVASTHEIADSARGKGTTYYNTLHSESTAAQSENDTFSSFNADGFTVATSGNVNGGYNYSSWTFRKQPKFFTCGTYTGTGSARTIAHDLGSTPGVIIVKQTSASGRGWITYHRSLGATKWLDLSQTQPEDTWSIVWNNTAPTSTEFTVGTFAGVNESGASYVYYAFAHDAGGFGLTGTDNVISCGSFTTNGSGEATVNLGYEPQWFMVKDTNNAGNWIVVDTMRGAPVDPSATLLAASLRPNLSNAESTQWAYPTSTGFFSSGTSSATYIYIAIRKGPMKVPTDATKVFAPIARTGTSSTASVTSGFVTDLAISHDRGTSGADALVEDRLRGATRWMTTTGVNAEAAKSDALTSFASMTGVTVGADSSTQAINYSGFNYANWFFRRAPSFMDVVCYTGNGTTQNLTHNLGAIPGLIFVKRRGASTGSWLVWSTTLSSYSSVSPTYYGMLNSTAAFYGAGYGNETVWGNNTNTVDPTSSVFTVGSASPGVNASGSTYVAYLFATCPGVSKVGSYTGTGSTQTINCGFTGGARFVLVKRTDSTGDWRVVDTARGMVSGNDPYLRLNTTDGEVNVNNLYTATGGFQLVSSDTNFNANGGTYIYLAIA